MHMCVGQTWMSSSMFFYHIFMRYSLSLNLELTSSTRLTDPQAPSISSALGLQVHSAIVRLLKNVHTGIELRSSCLHDKCFTDWTISPTYMVYSPVLKFGEQSLVHSKHLMMLGPLVEPLPIAPCVIQIRHPQNQLLRTPSPSVG